ncbi:polyphenol oxidase family protein [Nocardioides sp. JQ2195]|uniref:polyphenol oxidase family protein n=1 Tax=Nocardioides sp. JQ2195 TaxID=2592334 RepID=UPI00143EF088|nr:polyphenol oxidase family protein [Nocardioides sp. JQ2195]QIX26367.1 polyphenol oxidase family protein [Nocardioides sp. JQ2195]
MFAFRDVREGDVEGQPALDIAFTDRHAPAGELDLSLAGPVRGDATADDVLALLAREFTPEAPDALPIGMRQVHGAQVCVVDETDGAEIVADGVVTRRTGVTLLVRVADCVPVLLAATDHSVIAAVHAGRPGLVAGVVPAAIATMRDLGAGDLQAWVGPHVCGSCYEVPEQMREEVSAEVPEAFAVTSWGTPAVDIGAGVRAQLRAAGVSVDEIRRCTLEDDDLWSHRREGSSAGRLGGLIRISP